MALLKPCSKCGKVINQGNGSMCDECTSKAKTRHTEYDKTKRNQESSKIYSSGRWREVRHMVKVRDMYLCMLCYSNQRIKSAHTVHHIIPIEDDKGHIYVFNPNNLISVCQACHQKIHATYENNENEKMKLQKILSEIISKGVGEG